MTTARTEQELELDLHPILEQFLNEWVYPTGFSGPGYEFRIRQTKRFVPVWNRGVHVAVKRAEERLNDPSDLWKKQGAMGGYSGEGPQMSVKQMSTQIVSVTIPEQEKYIDLQRMRTRQLWDEVKHGQLHADVLLRGNWFAKEEELMDQVPANAQTNLSYFGQTAMFPHIHPLARAAQNYLNECQACLGIAATLSVMDDPLVRHEHFSQFPEERMHFIEGKYQLDAYAVTPEDQQPIREVFDWLLAPWNTKMPTSPEAIAAAARK